MEEAKKDILTPEEIEQLLRKLEKEYHELVNSGRIGVSSKQNEQNEKKDAERMRAASSTRR